MSCSIESASTTVTTGTTSTSMCEHIMKLGPRKGSVCGGCLTPSGMCHSHDPKTMAARNRRSRALKAEGILAKRIRVEREETEDALWSEMTERTAEMKAVGGWGSVDHGRFHTARRGWRDAVSRLSASRLNLIPETYLGWSKNAQEYGPNGKFGRCIDEECDCMVDGVYGKVGGRVTGDGCYLSDEDCSDYEDCEHEDGEVHDCEEPRPIPTAAERLETERALNTEIRAAFRVAADIEFTDRGEVERYRLTTKKIHKMLDKLRKMES